MVDLTIPRNEKAPHVLHPPANDRQVGHEVPSPLAPLARRPVLAVAGTVVVVLLLVSDRFGFFSDELYFIAAGRRPAWGYVDQPPLVPLLAQGIEYLTNGSLVALRLLPALAAGGGVVVSALAARELGGRRTAQVLAAVVYAVTPATLMTGHVLATGGLDINLAACTAWLLIRWIRLRDDRVFLAIALVTAVELQVKFVSASFWVVFVLCALVFGPRDIVRRPKFWIGAGIVAAAAVPGLVWQAQHGWPQVDMTKVIAKEVEDAGAGGFGFIAAVLSICGIAGSIFLVHGMVKLIGRSARRDYRVLGWSVLGIALTYALTDGRAYYLAGYLVIPLAAAAVDFAGKTSRRSWKWIAVPVSLLSLALVPVMLPMYPDSALKRMPDGLSKDMVGWPEMADTVADIYRSLPGGTRENTAVVTDGYQQASALDRYGPARHLPPAYSGHRGYWYFGRPAGSVTSVIYVGADKPYLDGFFESVRRVGTVDNHLHVSNLNRGQAIWLCRGPRHPWPQLWPRFYHLTAVTLRGEDVPSK
ncbi:glycosyltransferase family 39 protein [Streptomyces fagopyri]|uniref:glycosyltransferase family 39 protein n=1 Tax=Streptomyces fagopyri TaxID=2662397 RepID=UPI0036A43FFA